MLNNVPKDLRLAHDQDPLWLITLWLYIHGGDPGPDGVIKIDARSQELVAHLSEHLIRTFTPDAAPLTATQLENKLRGLGVQASFEMQTHVPQPEAETSPQPTFPHRGCFTLSDGTRYCGQLVNS